VTYEKKGIIKGDSPRMKKQKVSICDGTSEVKKGGKDHLGSTIAEVKKGVLVEDSKNFGGGSPWA